MTDQAKKLDARQLILDALDDPDSGLQDLVFVVRMSSPPRAEYVSNGMQNLLALPTDRLYDSLDRILEGVHPDDRSHVQAALADPANHSSVTYRYRTSESTWRWIEHRFTTRIDLGDDPMVIGIGRDVTEQVRARIEADQERDFLNSVLNTVGALVILLDDVGLIVRMNDAAERVTGFTQQEAEGRAAWDLWLPEHESDRVRNEFTLIKKGKGEDPFRNEIVTKSGDRRLIEWRNTTLDAASGRVEFIVATGIDVTATAEASDERDELFFNLRERVKEVTGLYRVLSLTRDSASVRDIVRHSPDPIRHAFTSPEETFVRVEIDGISAESPSFKRGEWALREPIVVEGVQRGSIEVSFHSAKEAHHGNPFIPEEQVLLGQIAQALGDDLKRRDTEEGMVGRATAMDATADAFAFTDAATQRFMYVNRAYEAQTGFSRDEVIGRPWSEFMPAPVVRQDHPDLIAALGRGHAWNGEMQVQRKDGSHYVADVSVTPVVNEDGRTRQFLTVMRDISERRAAELELQSRAAALDATAEMVLIAATDGTIEYVNNAFETQTGYSRAEAVGQHTRMLQSGHQPSEFYKNLWDTVLAGNVWAGELINRRKDGTEYVEEMTITPVKSPAGEVLRFVAIKRDISARKASEERLTLLAMTDPLTGLANRRQFGLHLDQALREATRRKSRGAVAYMDLDGFKEINDRLGHLAGDEALRQVGNVLRLALRRSDVVARMGGDEFAVLLHDAAPEAALAKVGQLVQQISGEEFNFGGELARLRCSAGVVEFPRGDESPECILQLADVALYQVKQAGGGAARMYDDGTHPGGDDPA